MIFHDSHDIRFRCPLGGVKAGEPLTLRLRCDEPGEAWVRLWDGSEKHLPMVRASEGWWELTLTAPEVPLVMWYDFRIRNGGAEMIYAAPHDGLGGVGQVDGGDPHAYQVTVYDPAYRTPDTLVNANIYQIFPDRFYRGSYRHHCGRTDTLWHEDWHDKPALTRHPVSGDNQALDFFGGSLRGIMEKLPYLEELGVTLLYLNPIFRARSNHRYDTGDYSQIDPYLGSNEDFERLAAEAEKRGMRLLLDGVFNHTGSDSLYFNRYGTYDTLGAYQSEQSPYAPWYTFTDFPDKYDCWWDFDTLPAVRKDNADYRRFLLNEKDGVVPAWIKSGASGWRLDVVDELPMELVAKIRAASKQARPDAFLLGEVWEDASNKVAYGKWRCYCLGDTLDGVMNYTLRDKVLDFFNFRCDAEQLRRFINHQREAYPAPFLHGCMNLLGSHDRLRAVNAMNGYHNDFGQIEELGDFALTPEQLALGKRRYAEAMKLLCALPGAPTVYYGDEIGMQGMRDPYNRAPMAWDSADKALHDEIAALLQQRRAQPLLRTGHMRLIAPDADTLAITRYVDNGVDALGNKAANGEVTVTVRRK